MLLDPRFHGDDKFILPKRLLQQPEGYHVSNMQIQYDRINFAVAVCGEKE
jgi:hypothetical protein